MDNLAGNQIKGYELQERIAAGGFGAVYRAYQSTIGREVAVKIILPGLANKPDFIRRFEAEAQLIARLEHPFIVPLHDYWRDPDGAYLVMRYLRGGSLQDYIYKHGVLSIEDTVNLFSQVAQGLHIAHRNQVIHRDIKPGNILLDEDGNAYLADFGIAKDKTTAQDLTEPDSVIGSAKYLAPEQALSEPVTPQTDIYSLGVVLYEMLVGEHPFAEADLVGVIFKHLNEPLPEITGLEDNISSEVNAVIQKATAKDPTHRYKDVIIMTQALRNAAQLDATPTPTSLVELLTPREQEVMQLIIDGKTNREIADILVLTEGTVKQYINNIYRKLKVRSRVQAIARARDLKFVVKKPEVHVTTGHLIEPDNPYKGLRAFHAADAQDFFGREQLTQKLLSSLQQNGHFHRFLSVVGPSGSGKSSVVKAGLIPAIWRGDLPKSENWYIIDMLPGTNPIDELEVALFQVATDKSMNLREQLQRDKRGLIRVADMILPDDESELLVVIDQFEEVFTLVEDETERVHFLNLLQEAMMDKRSRVRAVVTLRADYYDRPLQYPNFGELMRNRVETVLPLSAEELERAISEPAHSVGVIFEDGLVSRIISDVHYQPGALPLLQYALTELFERRNGRMLTLEAYQEIGGTGGALANRADEIYLEVSDKSQELIHQLFLRLVTLGEGAEDTRRRVERSELLAIADDREQMNEVIDLFAISRLLSLDIDPSTRRPTVEVAHEAILREWERLRVWLNESREEIRLQRQLANMAREWQRANKDKGFLAHGSRLDQFEKWISDTDLALTKGEEDFLNASIEERIRQAFAEQTRQEREQQLEKRSLTFLRALVGLLLLAVFGAFGLTSVAVSNANDAQKNFISAERIRLAAQAQIALEQGESGELPALLAIRSLRLGYSPEADTALVSALTRGFARQEYIGHTGGLIDLVFSADGQYILTSSSDNTLRTWDTQSGIEIKRFVGHTALITASTFSPDGQYILSASADGTARIWNVNTGEELRQLEGNTGSLWNIDISPDSQWIVTTDDSHNALLWNFETSELVRRFVGHDDTILWARFSPDGRYVATFSQDRTTRLWDVSTGEEIRRFVGSSDCDCSGSFSPNGRWLVTAGFDNIARIWDIATGEEIRRFVGHNGQIFDAVFSPDNRYLLTGSDDRTARLWDIETGQEIRRIIGHTGGVKPTKFSPDGRYVGTGSDDRTVRLWSVVWTGEPQIFALPFFEGYYADSYIAADISSDGKQLLTGSANGIIRLWDMQNNEIIGEEISLDADLLNDEAFSSDGARVVTAGSDGLVTLWDTQTGQKLQQFIGHEGPVTTIAFSADSHSILTGGADATIRLWDSTSGEQVGEFIGHKGTVYSAVFSSDGLKIISGGEDGIGRLWDVSSGQELRQFVGHTGAIQSAAFPSTGKQIVTVGDDRIGRLWDVSSGQELRQFVGHTDQITNVLFSPDDQHVLTGSIDQTARLWEVESSLMVRLFASQQNPVRTIAFSPDGQYIVTSDNQAYFWRTSLDDVIAFTCSLLPRDLTTEERNQYNLSDTEVTCEEFTQQVAESEATWTPVPTASIPQWTPIPSLDEPLKTEIEFLNDLDFGIPVQDVYINHHEGKIVRPDNPDEMMMAQPMYAATTAIEQDWLEPPFDVGPYDQGEALGFTLGEWLAAAGTGTYTRRGARAILDLEFTNMVRNGVYTLWCIKATFIPEFSMAEAPCGAADGSESVFVTDAEGYSHVVLELDAFPPSSTEESYQICVAYHSDGQSHGLVPGDLGFNAHTQLCYEFPPPANS